MAIDWTSRRSSFRPSGPRQRGQGIERRLLTLTTMLVLVVALMLKSRQPQMWGWMWRLSGQAPVASDVPLLVDAGATPTELPEADRLLDIDRTLLTSIRDDTFFRAAENDVWFRLLQMLRDHSPESIGAASVGPVSYLQLYRQTAAYRGQIVELTGTIRRAHRVTATSNQLGIADYWQCWLFLDAGTVAPIVVYCLDVPPEFPEGLKTDARVQLFACVYKRWSYQSQGGLTVAPVVLAKSLAWQPSADESTVKRPSLDGRRGLPYVLIGATGIGGIALAGWLLRRPKPRNSGSPNEVPAVRIGPPPETDVPRDVHVGNDSQLSVSPPTGNSP